MAANLSNATYEDLLENARVRSLGLGRYAAMVEITHYMQSRSRMTVAVSTSPIVSKQRGGEFVGVHAQYRNGLPFGDARPAVVAIAQDSDDDSVLPF